MGCDIARGFPIAGSPEERTGGRRRGKLHNHGSDDPPRTWSRGAPDRDGSASVASQVRIRTAGAYAALGQYVFFAPWSEDNVSPAGTCMDAVVRILFSQMPRK